MLKRWRERITPTDAVMGVIGGGIVLMVVVGATATLAAGIYAGLTLQVVARLL